MDSTFYVETGDKTIYTTVTADTDTVTDWINGVNNHFRFKRTVVFGLDVEWKPNWYPGERNPVATLQICAGNRCLIVQLLHIEYLPCSLYEFLQNPKYMFAGVEIGNDALKLEEDYDLICENLYDLRAVAKELWPDRFSHCPGLKELASEVADVWLEKPIHVSTSNWDNEVLDVAQIEYACLDAYASCRVGVNFYFDLDWDYLA